MSPTSNDSPTLNDLSRSHSQILGFEVNPLSHMPLSINSLHSHSYIYILYIHLPLFQRC